MGIRDLFRNHLSTIIEWNNPQPETLWWKYPNSNNEIKNASKLIVAPGQAAVLVYEGKVADVVSEPGILILKTGNHPFITTLMNLRQNFESEHKLMVFFYKTTQLLNQDWGTAEPVKYFDNVFHIPVQLGAYGNFSYSIQDIGYVHASIIGNRNLFTAKEMRDVITSRISQQIANALALRKVSFIEIDAQLNNISLDLQQQLSTEYGGLGLSITDFRISGTSFDDATRQRIDRIADVSADVKAANEAGLTYVELEQLRALRDAASNEGGLAGAGAQLGAGMEIGKIFSQEKKEVSKDSEDVLETLKRLKLLKDEGIITQEEFEAKKRELLDKL